MNDFSRFLRRLGAAALILACTACATAVQQGKPLEVASDLAAVGKFSAEQAVPVMLVFTRPECPYCARAKQDHLEPMLASRNHVARVIMREVVAADERTLLRDFDGNAITHGEFARRYAIRSVPTVIVVDARGKPLAAPIIGLTTPDFYNLYLEQAIDAGRVQLRR